MNKKGYTIPELLIVLGVVSLIALVSIVKVSYAFSDINNEEEIKIEDNNLIKKASLSYANTILDQVKSEKNVYISGNDLISKGFLMDDDSYKNLKIKLTYKSDTDQVYSEIVK